MDDEIIIEKQGSVAVATLNRPASLNAWTRSMQARYFDFIDEMDRDDAVKAVVITGAGRAYSAGAEVGGIEERVATGATSRSLETDLRMLRTLRVRKPVIAAVNGVCAGISVLQACACDIRIASPQASFLTLFARRGLAAEEAITWLLPKIVGLGNALDMLLSGRKVDAEKAVRIGLVNFIADDAFEAALDYANEISRKLLADVSRRYKAAELPAPRHRHSFGVDGEPGGGP